MRLLAKHNHPVGKLIFSPDSRRLLVISRTGSGEVFDSDAIRLWDVAAGTSQVLPGVFHPGFSIGRTADGFKPSSTAARALHPVFTPDGQSVLYVGGDGGTPPGLALRLFDLASGTATVLTVPDRGPRDFGRPLFTPDGSRLLSFSPWTSGRTTGGLVLNWTTYPAWQPAGQWRIIEPIDRDLARRNIFAAACSPCGKMLTTVSGFGLMVFDVQTGERLHFREVKAEQSAPFLAYHSSGRQLAFGSGTRVAVFDTRSWEQVAELRQKKKHVLSGAFTPDGRWFLTASNEETVKCWDTATWTLKRDYAWEIGGLRSVAVAPDGMTAAVGGDSTEVVLFDLDD
jgi:WD40 repeat protein